METKFNFISANVGHWICPQPGQWS